MDDQRDVVVVGGGLAGLAAAATAAGAGRSVLLLDGHAGANRAATDVVGRFRFNRGAHALYRTGAGRQVLDRLGVRVSGSAPPTAGSLGRRGDRVGRLPVGPASLATTPLVSARGKVRLARVLAGMRRWRPDALADRSGAVWLDELGLDGDERHMVEMLIRTTTYVADIDAVSADLVARQVRMGYVDGVDYLDGGWASLLGGLARVAAARGVARVGAAATAVVPEGDLVRVTIACPPRKHGEPAEPGRPGQRGAARERVTASGGEAPARPPGDGLWTVLAGAVVVAAGPPDACAAVLPTRPDPWDGLGPPVHIACLDLGLVTPPPTAVLLGVDRPLYLIRHAPPADLAPPGAAVVHTMRYLRADEALSPNEARADLEEHCRLAGIDPAAAEESRYLHRMTACGGLPTPETGGLAGRPGVGDTGLDGVFVAGDWLGSDGHLADAALSTGEAAGRRAVERVDRLGRAGRASGRRGGDTGRASARPGGTGARLAAHG